MNTNLLIALLLAISLSACGGGGSDTSSDTGDDAASSEGSSDSTDDGSSSGSDDDTNGAGSGDDTSDDDAGSDDGATDDDAGSGGSDGGSNGSGNGLTSIQAPAWSTPLIVVNTPSNESSITDYSIKSTSGGDALAAWTLYRSNVVGQPYDLQSVRYSESTSWSSVESQNSVGRDFRDPALHLTDSNIALIENNTADAYTYAPSRGWAYQGLTQSCCLGSPAAAATDSLVATLYVGRSSLLYSSYKDNGLVEQTAVDLPFQDTVENEQSRTLVYLSSQTPGTIQAIERVNHRYLRAPREGDPLATYTYSTLRESVYSNGAWSTPVQLHRSSDLGTSYTYPIDSTDIVVGSSPNGNVIVAWEERFAPNTTLRDYEYQSKATRKIGGTWETPQEIDPSITRTTSAATTISIDDNAHAVAIIGGSSYSSTQTVNAYTISTEGEWSSPVSLRHARGSVTVYQSAFNTLSLGDGRRLYVRLARASYQDTGVLTQWYIPGTGWTLPQYVRSTTASDSAVDSYSATLSDNGDVFIMAKQGYDYWVAHSSAPPYP